MKLSATSHRPATGFVSGPPFRLDHVPQPSPDTVTIPAPDTPDTPTRPLDLPSPIPPEIEVPVLPGVHAPVGDPADPNPPGYLH